MCWSEHYNKLQKLEERESNTSEVKASEATAQPLKDYTNIQSLVQNCQAFGKGSSQEPERPLKCLETLAEKAGISLDDQITQEKSEKAILDKSQSPAQGGNNSLPLPVHISQEHLQQLQQFQLQQQGFGTIQVKQEFPNQQSLTTELKPQIINVQDHQQQLQQMQVVEGQQSPHNPPSSVAGFTTQGTGQTINTLSPLQAMQAGQMSADWQQNRLQVLPQTAPFLQQLYTTGQPVVMSGNILHHPSLNGQQQIQLIAAGKAFQGPPQLATQQMLTTTAQGKQVLQTTGATGGFSGTYTLPGIPSSQSQTLVLSPFNVIGPQAQQQQQNLVQTINQQNANKQLQQNDNLQKQFVTTPKVHMQQKGNIGLTQNNSGSNSSLQQNVNQGNQQQQQCVQVSQTMPAQLIGPLQQQGQTMQFATPWLQGAMPFWTANGIQSQTLLAPNSILIRGTNPDGGQGMFIQQAPQGQQQQSSTSGLTQNQTTQSQQLLQCGNVNLQQNQQKIRATGENPLAPKQIPRAPPLLPQGTAPIRPASSVSTQTAQTQNVSGILTPKTAAKMRTKQNSVRATGPIIKTEGNQQKLSQQHVQQMVTSVGNKMVVMSSSTPFSIAGTNQHILQQGPTGNTQQILTTPEKQQQQMQIQYQQQQYKTIQQQQHQAILHQQMQMQMQSTQTPTQQQHQQAIQNQLIQNQQSQSQSIALLQGQPVVLQSQNGQQIAVAASSNINIQHPGIQQIQQLQPNQNMHTTQVNIQPKPLTSNQYHISTSLQQHNTDTKLALPIVSSSGISFTQTTSSSPSIQTNSMNHVSSPQSTIQAAQNPLLAITNLSTSTIPMMGTCNMANVSSASKDTALINQQAEKSLPNPSQNISISQTSVEQSMKSPNLCSTPVSNVERSILLSPEPKVKNESKSESLSAIIGSEEPNENAMGPTSKHPAPSPQAQPQPQANATTNALNGNSSTLATPTKNEKGLPKAMVKPSVMSNVLTHVIEGFVIQEANEPFPVLRQRYSEHEEDEPSKKRLVLEGEISKDEMSSENKTKNKRKRFCSSPPETLTKEEIVQKCIPSDTQGKPSTTNASLLNENTLFEATVTDTSISPDTNTCISNWSVIQVCNFVEQILGTDDYREDFTNQEIDGSALVLLKEKHLVNAMGMKLGPALKIVDKVQVMNKSNVEEAQNVSNANSNQ